MRYKQHIFLLSTLVWLSNSPLAAADCYYSVSNEWNNGFTAKIQISNTGDTAINDWEVSWAYTDGSLVTSHWNADVTGSKSYLASPQAWNGQIMPGQTIEFGLQGDKGEPGSPAQIPELTGDVCGTNQSIESSSSSDSLSSRSSQSSNSAQSSSTPQSSRSSSPVSSSVSSVSSIMVSSSSSSLSSSAANVECIDMCQWYEDGEYSLCQNITTGWGWEGKKTCIGIETCLNQFSNGGVVQSCTQTSVSSTASASSEASSSTSSSETSSTASSSSSTVVHEGMSTYFEGLGMPYGGCGVPQDELETEHFVALNVFNSPGIYKQWPRPISGDDLEYMGEFQNGLNCGRWVRVTMGSFCKGINDGVQNEPFCRNGSGWIDDDYTGATLDFIVADSCGDDNSWCRDSQYHLDFSKHSLNQFELDGAPVGDLLPDNYNNRRISWEYIEAPNYSGDIRIFFMKGAQEYWPTILITQLRNGIHSVEQLVDGQWVVAERNHDMGQSFILQPVFDAPYVIRIRDANDALINNGRQYEFSLPEACGTQCSEPVTETIYTTH